MAHSLFGDIRYSYLIIQQTSTIMQASKWAKSNQAGKQTSKQEKNKQLNKEKQT